MPGPLFPIQNFVAKPYSGSLQGINVSLLSKGGIMTNDGQQLQQGQQSRIVNATIDFLSTTNRGQAISINLQSQNNTPPLNKILMIYVDNELNSQNVTVAFPDTQQYIGVPAFTTGYYPVLTGQLLCVVYNGTTGKVPVTSASQCSVIFCNFAIPGFLSQETLSITYNSSSGPVVPAIGDQVQTNTIGNTNFNPDTILSAVAAPIQYVITGIEVNAFNLFLDGSVPINDFYGAVYLVDTNSLVVSPIRVFVFNMTADPTSSKFQVLTDETGLNIPCQGLTFIFATSLGITANIPAWCKFTVSITYAKVTL